MEEIEFLEEVRDREEDGAEILEAHWEGLKGIAERLTDGPGWGTAIEPEETKESEPFDDSNVDPYDPKWDGEDD